MQVSDNIIIGVGAVVFRGPEVLVIKRGHAPLAGRWSIPGGKLHHGEKVTDAAIREVREETGIEIDLIGLLDVFDALPGDSEGEFTAHIVMIDYVAEWASGEPVAGDDAAEAEFVSVEEAISRLSWDVTRQSIKKAYEIRTLAQTGKKAL